jgi:hypothetical protein
MTNFRSLFAPTPARPGHRPVERIQVENVSDEQRSSILDALEWSDLDSSSALVARTDAVVAQLSGAEAAHTGAEVSKPVGVPLPTV